MTLSTPPGRPASCAIVANSQEVAGVSSAAFSTAALPQISAGNTFHAVLAMGVLAAMMRPATPQRLAHRHGVFVGRAARGGAAIEPLALASEEAAERNRPASLAEGLFGRFAGLLGHDLSELLLPRLERVAHPM